MKKQVPIFDAQVYISLDIPQEERKELAVKAMCQDIYKKLLSPYDVYIEGDAEIYACGIMCMDKKQMKKLVRKYLA